MLSGATQLHSFLNSSPGVPEKKVSDEGELDLTAVILTVITILLGIPGNAIVIWVAGFKLKTNVLNVWLVNLAVADIIFCLTRIFSLITVLFVGNWFFGLFICRFIGFFKYANMFYSVFMLAVISVDRAICVQFPVFTRRHRTVFAGRVVALCTWVAVVLFSLPFFIYRRVFRCNGNLNKCRMDRTEDAYIRMLLYIIRFLCGFLVPFLVILGCYIIAGVGIQRTRLSGKSRPLRMLALLVSTFFLCWAPYHILLILRMVDGSVSWVIVWLPTAKGVAYFNSCINPLLYFFVGLKLKGQNKKSLEGLYRSAMADDVDE
ncbi:C3a anaphylatoxin chemotactic receptor-like [Syngnathoides biaculeatus]|uniref:C3a anaphylatoxin chemotactic receptor-like n=1 Tax=Syngnathoides biaculeatus TaxID=300417 RepID=UPI002ADD92FF|nr:C3a anaphylatoxin chemotactic receptor-like [Syngnathoides biaculeatus]